VRPPLFAEAASWTDLTPMRHSPSVSKVETGFHGVQLTIRSITDLLPASSEAGDGLPYGQAPAGKTSAEIRETMRKDDEALDRDELARKYLWNAEEEVWKGREEELDAGASPEGHAPRRTSLTFRRCAAQKASPTRTCRSRRCLPPRPSLAQPSPSARPPTSMSRSRRRHAGRCSKARCARPTRRMPNRGTALSCPMRARRNIGDCRASCVPSSSLVGF
jgi:hypothetical protein